MQLEIHTRRDADHTGKVAAESLTLGRVTSAKASHLGLSHDPLPVEAWIIGSCEAMPAKPTPLLPRENLNPI